MQVWCALTLASQLMVVTPSPPPTLEGRWPTIVMGVTNWWEMRGVSVGRVKRERELGMDQCQHVNVSVLLQ